MSRAVRFLAYTVALATLSAPAAAQQPPMANKWDASSRTLVFHNDLPIQCDDPAINAVNYLVSVDPAFSLPMRWQATVNPADQTTSTVAASQQGYGGSITAGTTIKSYTDPYWWESYGTLVDADIYMNYDLLFYPGTSDAKLAYDLWCGSAYQGSFTAYNIDYQSAFLHELGHLVGFGERTDAKTGPCVMHPQMPRGQYRRVLCADEKSTYANAY